MIDLIRLVRKYFLLLFSLLFLNNCSYLASSATEDFGRNLKQAIVNHNDPQMVVEAIPSYLLLQESLLAGDPDNETLLMSTANLYTSYISLVGTLSPERKLRISQTAFDHALHGACVHKPDFCALNEKVYDDFVQVIQTSDVDDLDILYGLGTSWANWVQSNKADWNAVAQLAQVKYIINHVIKEKDDYKKGEAYLYAAVMESIVPPALGGKPDIAKHNFEKALQLSDNKNLMVYLLYAKRYARMLFDRELHDTLLNKVIDAKAEQNELTLSNILAQQQAKKLLESADEYF
ncbi:MAG: hypothetical protein KAH20_04435 [Methylococcales bacterium]|nr:hypothetical protein [Methylococcales bacterium]